EPIDSSLGIDQFQSRSRSDPPFIHPSFLHPQRQDVLLRVCVCVYVYVCMWEYNMSASCYLNERTNDRYTTEMADYIDSFTDNQITVIAFAPPNLRF
ncbi:unnamed protein product, partial [Onchocerca flexuosa]|uniref:SLC12 domain-containing protein n=1 Tax=Onchocerca flexuosa TaxID=387005 RepID=A0A183I3V2_9BILA